MSDGARLRTVRRDGIVATRPDAELIDAFESARDEPGSRYGQLSVCVADTEEQGVATALEWWPNGALRGPLGQELPLPSHFEEAAAMVTEDDIAEAVVCGPDPSRIIAALDEYRAAGFTHVYVHQIGPDQESLFRVYESVIASWAARELTLSG